MSHPKMIISVATIILLFSCDTKEKITTYKIKKPEVIQPTEVFSNIIPIEAPSDITSKQRNDNALKLNWTTPSAWEELEPGNMLMANFNVIDSSKNKSTNISISMFPGNVGGIENNVNRWRNQINLKPQTMVEISKYIQDTTLPLLGDAQIVNLNNPQNNQGMKVVIIPNQNNQTIFVKMMGEFDSVSELDYEFNIFLQSIHWGE